MSIGPCLCGDPYCPSCGDPGASLREDWVCHIDELTCKFTDYECRIFESVGLAAVKAHQQAQKDIRAMQLREYEP